MWIRRGTAVMTCPVSYIHPASLAWVEEFVARKTLGAATDLRQLPARTVEAFCILEHELAKEIANGERRQQ